MHKEFIRTQGLLKLSRDETEIILLQQVLSRSGVGVQEQQVWLPPSAARAATLGKGFTAQESITPPNHCIYQRMSESPRATSDYVGPHEVHD